MIKSITRNNQYETIIYYAIYIAITIHFFWMLWLFWQGFPTLGVANAVSCLLYGSGYFLVQRKAYKLYAVLWTGIILSHAVLATLTVGWDAGFHYYVIIIVYALFFLPDLKWMRLIAFTITVGVYIWLYSFSHTREPAVDADLIFSLHLINVITLFMIIAILGLLFRRKVNSMIQSLNYANRQLGYAAATDTLTNLLTRRKISEYIDEWTAAKAPFYIMMADIDHFKKINDEYGHSFGDKVLMLCAEQFADCVDSAGFVSRWGGEEFLVIFKKENNRKALALAEEIRESIDNCQLLYRSEPVHVTVSIGIAQWQDGWKVEDAIDAADYALYDAKKTGRNCICQFDIKDMKETPIMKNG